MRNPKKPSNPYADDKVIDSCSLFGIMNTERRRFSSRDPVRAMSNMRERGNGLGGGFAVYGIYPEYEDVYALHAMYMSGGARKATEECLGKNFRILFEEEIPTEEAEVWDPPLVRRYFVEPRSSETSEDEAVADEYVVKSVIKINAKMERAFVFSSGKNMGIFKGVGFPEAVAEYYRLQEYQGYMWICHGRFPTNTPGWWGGAQPFGLLDWSVAHNGELSSYGANRRYLEMCGYNCTMQTDTEVLAYALDLLVRRHGIPPEFVAKILAPPFWTEISHMEHARRCLLTAMRQTYGSLLMNGPFSIVVGHKDGMMGLTDRIKLRPLTAALKGEFFYLSSEEAAIRVVSPDLERVWNPAGGEIVMSRLRDPRILKIPVITTRAVRM